MATSSLQGNCPADQEARAREQPWEEECYRRGCACAQQEAIQRLQALEQRLHAQRPATWTKKGWVARTLVTRVGDLRIRRRLSQYEHGAYQCDMKSPTWSGLYGLGDPVRLSSSEPCVPGNGEVRSAQKRTDAWEPYLDVGREEGRYG